MRFLLAFFTFLFLTGCYETERNCADFKTGTFEFEALSGTEVFKTTIVRNDSIEVDYFQGKTDSSSIRWINDCEYVLKKINPKNQAEKKAILIKILTTDGDNYTFEFSEVGKTKKSKATAKRVQP
ncbi:PH domain-containing protein [Aequorivita vladivostokensis]|uniref:DNA topoisomerase IV subunit A n=1 Tax=Aequorivita vladivostokensis TaxID=171194 RepID=A0ABR5DF75_9FLAO|nr:DNA topoisomerase IV subunit A [Aequorivita vladivostokensis]MAB58110.1 DNA topoisomerase IV [Aequorivita sp.]KJJ37434.1 DNA topoisomerase IV subunit A [Aequorivita vladivostokensis]MAO47798.1 DNA topoisomerase IV [Aequorivita sp.]MBF30230.1 DNA topoisomerase IV [Aequorivita sp.]HBL79329.1 DNA topoisomerase IV [Aequorivita sp.]|tara:strand:+ start:310841 stop:311215 length:375 start_codon:yes stop_codon:yes gene_type:complete